MDTVGRVVRTCIAAGLLAGAVVAGDSTASAAPTTHTVHVKAIRLQLHQSGHTFVFAEKDLIGGKVVGYDSATCHYVVHANTTYCDASFSRVRGLTHVHLKVDGSGHGTGKITGGTGAYRNATGTVKFVGLSQTRSKITLVYKG
jgi:hypothetical protein